MVTHASQFTDDGPALGDDSTAADEPGDLRPLVSPPQSLVELKQEYEGGNEICASVFVVQDGGEMDRY